MEAFGKPWTNKLYATSHMDHVTYVCRKGESSEILAWYGDIFKMKRFLVNPQESKGGVEIAGDVNMRLTVGEWMSSWLCREEGVQFQDENTDRYILDRMKINLDWDLTLLCKEQLGEFTTYVKTLGSRAIGRSENPEE